MQEGPTKSQCAEVLDFHERTKLLAVFLKLYDAKPIDTSTAASIISRLLRAQEEQQLTAKEQKDAEGFFKNVDDTAHFGPKADLSETASGNSK